MGRGMGNQGRALAVLAGVVTQCSPSTKIGPSGACSSYAPWEADPTARNNKGLRSEPGRRLHRHA